MERLLSLVRDRAMKLVSLMDVLDQEIDEGPDAGREMFVAGIDGVDELHIVRIIGLQHGHKGSGIDIRLHMELTDTGEAETGQAKAAGGRPIVCFEVAEDRS